MNARRADPRATELRELLAWVIHKRADEQGFPYMSEHELVYYVGGAKQAYDLVLNQIRQRLKTLEEYG